MIISVEAACRLLEEGGVVALPTETVYGLAACYYNTKAIDQIFALKNRPANNPLIIHIASAQSVADFALMLPDDFHALTNKFWPGPLTLVVPVHQDKIPGQVRAGLSTAAFRVPKHAIALEVLKTVGPIVMPSANKSGRPSSTHYAHVLDDFGNDFPVVDGGQCECGIESTILCCDAGWWKIARQGALSAEEIASAIGYEPQIAQLNSEKPLCPGQLYRHYAPKAKLILTDSAKDSPGVVLGYSGRKYPNAERVIFFGDMGDPGNVAENLYSILRQLDSEGIVEAFVDMDIPQNGLWLTIRERLMKASAI